MSMRERMLSAGVGVVVLAAAIVGAILGAPLWLVWVVLLGFATLVFGTALGWVMAFTGAFVVGVTLQALWLRVTPLLHLDLATGSLVLAGVLGAGTAVACCLPSLPVRHPARDSISRAAAASLVTLLSVVAVLGTVAVSGTSKIAWAMSNDAVTSVLFARHMISDGGMNPGVHTNPVPLPYELLGAVMEPGRENASTSLLQHDVEAMAQLWILFILLSSLLCGIIAVRLIRPGRPVLRFAAGIAGGLFPLTWYVTGYTIEYGFFNATIAIVLLLAGWLIWQEGARHPVAAFCLLLVTSTALLGSWGPLAFLTLALAAVLFATRWRLFVRESSVASRALVIVSVLQVGLYGLLVTVPDFLREAVALGGEGGMFKMSSASLAISAGVAILLALAASHLSGSREMLIGLVTVLVASLPVLAYFLWARRDAANLWGYYPAKFAWVLSILFLVASVACLFLIVQHLHGRRLVQTVAIAGGALAILGIMFETPPARVGFSPYVPLYEVWRGWQGPEKDVRAATLFALSDEGERSFVVRLDGQPNDTFYNMWLLQVNLEDAADPVRSYAYLMDPESDADICTVGELLGGNAIVFTRDALLPAIAAERCAPGLLDVRVTP